PAEERPPVLGAVERHRGAAAVARRWLADRRDAAVLLRRDPRRQEAVGRGEGAGRPGPVRRATAGDGATRGRPGHRERARRRQDASLSDRTTGPDGEPTETTARYSTPVDVRTGSARLRLGGYVTHNAARSCAGVWS